MSTPGIEALRARFPTKPSPTKMAHVVLRTPKYDEMRAFYMKLLNAHVAFENDQVSFITYDDEHHRLGFFNFPHLTPQDMNSAGFEHVAFTYPDLPSLLAAYLHNKEQGIEPFWPINHGPTISMYYKDPDGNKVELQYDVFETNEEVDDYFASGAHSENFIGVIFSPEDMIEGLKTGVDVAELVRRPKLPEGVTPWDMVRT